MQALSVRVFGFHVWSVVLPQAVEGTLTVLVLYRAVRRVAGAGAGLAAAAVLAATPVTILLNRGNISDSLLILLLVLAADATTAAFTTGRLALLLVAGVWVGLAFQAKMLQAWLVLPALFLAYLLAAPSPVLARRLGHVALAALVALGVSLSWMLVVTVVPAHDRPYVDGSCNNSVFSQVFLYNGADRLTGDTLDQPGCSPAPDPGARRPPARRRPPSPSRRGPAASSTASSAGTATGCSSRPPSRSAASSSLAGASPAPTRCGRPPILWAAWLFFTWCFFASSHFINSYYLAALAPPIAALCGMGLAVAWRLRTRRATRAVMLGTVAAGTAYVLYLLPTTPGCGPGSWPPRCCSRWRRSRSSRGPCSRRGRRGPPGRRGPVGRRALPRLGLGVGDRRGGRAGALRLALPAGRAHRAGRAPPTPGPPRSAAGLDRAAARVAPSVSVVTSETSSGSSVPILATGREFLPVGGFTGRVPSPTLAQFVGDVRAAGSTDVLAAVAPRTRNPDMLWAIAHCPPLPYRGPDADIAGRTMRFFLCSPADAGR